MNVTINDIARATGLSTATISKYINHKKIREENRILIEKAIQSLDIPQTGMPSFFVPKHTYHRYPDLRSCNYFWGELVNSIIKHFTDHAYTVIVCSFFFEHQKEIDDDTGYYLSSTLTELSCSHPCWA